MKTLVHFLQILRTLIFACECVCFFVRTVGWRTVAISVGIGIQSKTTFFLSQYLYNSSYVCKMYNTIVYRLLYCTWCWVCYFGCVMLRPEMKNHTEYVQTQTHLHVHVGTLIIHTYKKNNKNTTARTIRNMYIKNADDDRRQNNFFEIIISTDSASSFLLVIGYYLSKHMCISILTDLIRVPLRVWTIYNTMFKHIIFTYVYMTILYYMYCIIM